jgi:hypothetical protein
MLPSMPSRRRKSSRRIVAALKICHRIGRRNTFLGIRHGVADNGIRISTLATRSWGTTLRIKLRIQRLWFFVETMRYQTLLEFISRTMRLKTKQWSRWGHQEYIDEMSKATRHNNSTNLPRLGFLRLVFHIASNPTRLSKPMGKMISLNVADAEYGIIRVILNAVADTMKSTMSPQRSRLVHCIDT